MESESLQFVGPMGVSAASAGARADAAVGRGSGVRCQTAFLAM